MSTACRDYPARIVLRNLKNIRQTNTVEDVQLNFGASKLTVDAAIHFNIRQNGDSYTILVL